MPTGCVALSCTQVSNSGTARELLRLSGAPIVYKAALLSQLFLASLLSLERIAWDRNSFRPATTCMDGSVILLEA